MLNKKILISIASIGLVVGTGLTSLQSVYADNKDNYSPIVARLVEKFNLNTSEVDTVLNQYREERHNDQVAKVTERLNVSVQSGDITEEQKQLILNKLAEMSENRPGEYNGDRDDRREAMKLRRAELEKWAADNNIDAKYLPGLGNMGEGRGMGKGKFN